VALEESSGVNKSGMRPSGHWVSIAIVLVGLATLAAFAGLRLSLSRGFQVSACFQNVNGLRKGAKVRLAGVDIGFVSQVRAQPTEQQCLAHIEMAFDTPYALKIPRDSVALTETAGVLGETYIEIDSSQASGAPIERGGILPTRSNPSPSAQDWLTVVNKALDTVGGARPHDAGSSAPEQPCPQQESKNPAPKVQK